MGQETKTAPITGREKLLQFLRTHEIVLSAGKRIPSRFFTIADVTDILNTEPVRIENLFRSKDFPSCTLGKRKIVEAHALLRYLATHPQITEQHKAACPHNPQYRTGERRSKEMASRKKGRKGSIFFDKNRGRWRGKISNGVSEDGKLLYKTVYGKSKAEAERKLEAFEKEREKKQGLVESQVTLNDLMIRANETDYKKRLIKESTYARRVSTQKAFEKFFLASVPIADIRLAQLEEFLSEITIYSNSSIKKFWQMINRAFDRAVWDRIIERNPMAPAGVMKSPEASGRTDRINQTDSSSSPAVCVRSMHTLNSFIRFHVISFNYSI